MANKEIVTDFENPAQVADLAKREGPEGLLRLVDYFETTGQRTPVPVMTALMMSRGPGVFPEAGAFLQKAKPSLTKEPSIYNDLGSLGKMSDDLVVLAAGQGRPEAIAERARRTSLALGKPAPAPAPARSTPTPMLVPESLRRSDWVTARPASAPQQTPPLSQLNLGVVPVPPPDSRSVELLGPFFRPVDESTLPPEGIRLPIEEPPTMTAPARSIAAAPEADAPTPAAPAPAVTPVPKVDAGGATMTTTPPPKTEVAAEPPRGATPPPPAAPMPGAGSDTDLDRLAMAQGIIQGLESFGSAVSGKNLRSGMADTLGERYRQAQALMAKREEKGLVDAQAQANNRAQVEYLMQRFPERREALARLRDMTKSPNFAQMLRVEEQIALDAARAGKTRADTGAVPERIEQRDTQLTETERHNRAMEAAAFLRAQRAAGEAAGERGVKPEALTNRLEKLKTVTQPYQELASALQEADNALTSLGTGQVSTLGKVGAKLGVFGRPLVTTPELRALEAQQGLKESYQKLKTGLAAVGQELTSFENRFGLNWYSDPRKAPLAIETLKGVVRDALARSQAAYGAGTGRPEVDQLEVLSILKNTGGLTADSPIFRPNPALEKAAGMTSAATAAPRAAVPAPVEGKVRMRSPEGRTAKIPAGEVEARKAQGWTEAP